MAFAGNSVAIEPAPAVQGDRVNNGAIFYTAHNFLTASTCNVGEFVWRDTTNPEIAVKNSAASGLPLGIVERTHEYTALSVDSLTVPAKANVTIVEKGEAEASVAAFNEAQSLFDKAVVTGVIHRNTAARKKALMAAKVKALSGETAPAAE